MEDNGGSNEGVVEHKGSAGRDRRFCGYLLNYEEDACTVDKEGLYGKCRVPQRTRGAVGIWQPFRGHLGSLRGPVNDSPLAYVLVPMIVGPLTRRWEEDAENQCDGDWNWGGAQCHAIH